MLRGDIARKSAGYQDVACELHLRVTSKGHRHRGTPAVSRIDGCRCRDVDSPREGPAPVIPDSRSCEKNQTAQLR